MPSGMPMTQPMPTATLACQAMAEASCRLGEAERLEEGQVGPPPADRGDEGQPQGDDRAGGQGGAEEGRGGAQGTVVEDLRRAFHTLHDSSVALDLRVLADDRLQRRRRGRRVRARL